MTAKYDIAIIGSGLGGLISGAKLAREGKKVILIEQHSIPGGCATGFKRKGYNLEVGLHELDGLHPEDSKTPIYKDLGIFDNIQFETMPDFYRVTNGDFDFVMPSSFEQAILQLCNKYPDQSQGIKKVLNTFAKIRKEASNFPKFKKPFGHILAPFIFPNLAFGGKKTIADLLNKHLTNEELKLVILANLSYYHDNPATMSLHFYSAAQASYLNGGSHFIKGGSQKLSNYLASLITDNGGEIFYNHLATKIIMDKGHTQGVLIQPINETSEILIKATTVIANAAMPTIPSILPSPYSEELFEQIKDLEPGCSILTVYLCMKNSTSTLGNKYYTSMHYDTSCDTMDKIYPNAKGPYEKRNYILIDYSLVDSQLNPPDKPTAAICMIDYLEDWDSLSDEDYKAKKEALAQSLFVRLEKEFPGFTKNIVYHEVGTARTVKRYTLNPAGSPYGYAQTPEQAFQNRPQAKSSIPGLYFASAWGFPGGGFAGATISGWLCAKEILHDTTL